MSPQTPTTQDINDNIIAQLEATLNQTIPLLPKAFNRVLSKALAGVFILVYKYAGFSFLQMFISKATIEETEILGQIVSPLIEWGVLSGVGRPEPATNAELLIDITVEIQSGSLPAGTQLLNASNGVTYITIAAVALDAPTVQTTVRAVSDQSGGQGAGVIGNLDAGAVVSFANPLSNVSRDAVVNSQTVTGADGEAEEAYRQRVLDRWQARPQGGAAADYQEWGTEPAGIIYIYPYTGDPGQVDVYAEATPESSGSEDGIPTTAQLDEVQASIQYDDNGLASRRPLGSFVNVYPIERIAFDLDVFELTVDNETQVQADIETAVDELLRSREPFIEGLTPLPRADSVSNTVVSSTISDVVSAAGGTFSGVRVSLDSVSISVYYLAEGQKAKIGVVTYS